MLLLLRNSAPVVWINRNLVMWRDLAEGAGLLGTFLPFAAPVRTEDEALVRLTGVTLSGTGVIGTLHLAVAGTFNNATDRTYAWQRNGVTVGTGTSYTPTAPTFQAGDSLTVVEEVTGYPFLVSSSEVSLVTGGSGITWPDTISPALLTIEEITDPDDPDAGTFGGKRRFITGAITVPSGFTFWVSSSALSGGNTASAKQLAASATSIYDNGLTIGTTNYCTAFWRHTASGEFRGALPSTGTTANGKTLAEIPTAPGFGQVTLTIEGLNDITTPGGDWEALAAPHVASATAATLCRYIPDQSGGSNFTKSGNTAVALAYASYKGDTSADTRTLAQLANFLTPANTMLCAGGVPAQRENAFGTFANLLKLTPRLWGDTSKVTAAQQNAVTSLMRCMLVDAAWMGSDSHPRVSGQELTQRGIRRTDRSVGGNISFAIPSRLQNAAAFLGVNTAKNYIQSLDRAALRGEVGSRLGTGSNAYETLNWRSEGNTSVQFLNGLSSAAPTDAQVEAALKNWTFGGKVFEDFEGQVLDTNYGVKKIMPEFDATATGNDRWIGQVQYGLLNNAGLEGGTRGIILNPGSNGAGTPHLGDSGCMLWELNARDGEGLRSSMPYVCWTARMLIAWMISLEVTNSWDPTTTGWQTFLANVDKAMEVFEYFDLKGYNSYAHAGTQGGGGGGPQVWDAGGGPTEYLNAMNIALWRDVLVPKLGL